MTVEDRSAAAEAFYAPLRESPSGARRVGWESEAAHLLRLRAIVEGLGDVSALDSVVDAGCGEGALVPELRRAGFAGRYLGEDILPAMVDVARDRPPSGGDAVCEFRVADSLAGGADADAVVCSGLLNALGDQFGHDDAVVAALGALWDRARHVLVVDLAVRDRHPPSSVLTTATLSTVWAAARALTPVVTVREDVAPGEAMLVLRRDRAEALGRLLGHDGDPISRARIHLTAGEPDAAIAALAGDRSPDGAAWRGLAALAAGRPRDAEAVLAPAVRESARARLHLAVVFLATRRRDRGLPLLVSLATDEGVSVEAADEARVLLARDATASGDPASATEWQDAIVDPFLAREA